MTTNFGISRRQILRDAALATVFWHTKGFRPGVRQNSCPDHRPLLSNRLPLDLDNDLLLIKDSITPSVGEIMWV